MKKSKIPIEEKIGDFRNKVGIILTESLYVETSLEFFISNYFVKPQTQKTFFLNDTIILRLNFDKKIDLFREICKREGYDMKDVEKVIKAIKFVQETRNKVAHWQTEIISEEAINDTVQLRKRTSYTTRNDILKLDDTLMEKLIKKSYEATRGINKYQQKYWLEGTKEERGVVDFL